MHPVRISLEDLEFVFGASEEQDFCIRTGVLQNRTPILLDGNEICGMRLIAQNLFQVFRLPLQF